MITYRIGTLATLDGQFLRAESDERGLPWAAYDRDGNRVAAGSTASAEWLAMVDATASVKAAELFAVRDAKVATRTMSEQATKGAIKARFGGTCAVTSRAYGRGTLIRNTSYGWAVADAATMDALRTGTMGESDPNWLTRQMDREDSMF